MTHKPGLLTRLLPVAWLGLGLALASAPMITLAQVSEATRTRVEELQKDSNFKLRG